MIQIKRAQCPSTLKVKGGHTDRFRNKQVVRTLWDMQNKKCCYCEQLIPAEGHAKAVEHFRPKSIFKSQRNDWRNLLLACAQCNGKKSDKFPVLLSNNVDQPKIIYLKRKQTAEPAMINPSNDKINPGDHLDYYLDMSGGTLVGQILERNKSLLGRTTIDVTNIDQP
ncbi:MAG: HNH endonuclease, partial [Chloroflexi bacterium]|nr:HNH endonuclease [Chloroflexota bacterium]